MPGPQHDAKTKASEYEMVHVIPKRHTLVLAAVRCGKVKKHLTFNKTEVKMKHFYILIISLFLITDSLGQWVQQNSGTINKLSSVYFTDVNVGYAVGDSGTILHTTDGGLNWVPQNSGTMYNLNSVHLPDANTGIAVGVSGTILHTTDGGLNWVPQN
jgi:photosystem II stability/assembly factor-like uncharacterized protein